jgi:branched-chain amino acid transport system permease protein
MNGVELQGRKYAGMRTSLERVSIPFVIVVLLILPFFSGTALMLQVTSVLIFVLFACSLNLLVGTAGMVSMGHAAFFAIGGYTAGICARDMGMAFPVAATLGVLASVTAALVVGSLSTRLSHAYFIMLTLAFGQLIHALIWKWRTLTGGDDGFVGIQPPHLLQGVEAYYWFTLAVCLACVAVLWRIVVSPFGVTLAAIRDNPSRASAIGINVYRFRLAAFILSGAFSGIAGILQAFFSRGMFPDAANFSTSANALVAILLGGAQYFFGPIVGGMIFVIARNLIAEVTPYWPLALGSIICVIAVYRPDGLLRLVSGKASGGAP